MNRDLKNNIENNVSVAPQVATADVDGTGVDLQDYDSVAVLVTTGAITGAAGDAVVTLEESDDDITYTAVSSDDIIGTTENLVANSASRFGYRGTKRYIRAAFALGGETNVAICADIVGGDLKRDPIDLTFPSVD